MESRGNDPSCSGLGSDRFGSTLHWGTNWDQNRYEMTHATYVHTESLGDAMHTYGMVWTENGLYTYIDDDSKKVLQVDFTS